MTLVSTPVTLVATCGHGGGAGEPLSTLMTATPRDGGGQTSNGG
jgi:hypothetical protein